MTPLNAELQTKCFRPDGSSDCFLTTSCDVRVKPLWWQDAGLTFTASGYGRRIPTRYMIRIDGKWRRVYCIIFSNCGTLFIGKIYDGSAIVNIW